MGGVRGGVRQTRHRLLALARVQLVRKFAGDLWLAYSGSINADVLLKCFWSGTSPCIYHGLDYTCALFLGVSASR